MRACACVRYACVCECVCLSYVHTREHIVCVLEMRV